MENVLLDMIMETIIIIFIMFTMPKNIFENVKH